MNQDQNNNNNQINYSTYNEHGAQMLQQTGANYVEEGTTPHHVDTSSLDKKKKSNPVLLVILFLLIIFFGAWAFIVYQDFGRVKSNKEPQFCWFGTVTEEIKVTESYKGPEGTIVTCTGPGYKVVKYTTINFKVTEFVPLWEVNKTLQELDESNNK